jgi:type II secretory pathway pseudopilin PulG
MAGVVQYLVIALVLGFAMLIFLPRLMRFVERANEEKLAAQQTSEVESVKVGDMRRDGSDGDLNITLYEKHGDIDFNEFESLSPEAINEIEEWNRQNPTLNIYDDDVEIENYKRVEK